MRPAQVRSCLVLVLTHSGLVLPGPDPLWSGPVAVSIN